ncbi:hypothetical protein [Pedobacter aquatilis]|uniref:hypothetical protein n=1 Tax=Pedobacter aquatilis TaxID=351343 RepID=UPI00292CD285|nr:hypothetical protein [Pedobacter aquatilis]
MDNHKLIQLLRSQVIEQFGISFLEENGCKRLSETIFESTKNYLSERTLLQFFTFNNPSSFPKPFVLNSLCQLIGLESWDEYVKTRSADDKAG